MVVIFGALVSHNVVQNFFESLDILLSYQHIVDSTIKIHRSFNVPQRIFRRKGLIVNFSVLILIIVILEFSTVIELNEVMELLGADRMRQVLRQDRKNFRVGLSAIIIATAHHGHDVCAHVNYGRVVLTEKRVYWLDELHNLRTRHDVIVFVALHKRVKFTRKESDERMRKILHKHCRCHQVTLNDFIIILRSK